MKKNSGSLLNWLIGIVAILGIGWLTWKTGLSFNWSWVDFRIGHASTSGTPY